MPAFGGARPASFLPGIKCSDCGDDVEIAAMGDHICGQVDPPVHMSSTRPSRPSSPEPPQSVSSRPGLVPSPLQQSESASQPRNRFMTLNGNRSGSSRPGRAPLPKINAEVANRPFMGARHVEPGNPISPVLSSHSGSSNGGKPAILRSMTSPMPRLYDPEPPSPEMSVNLDCAFPPFPPKPRSNSRPSTSNGRKTPNGSESSSSRSGSRLEMVRSVEPGPYGLEPKSPRNNAGENVLQRMNTLRSGPFNAKPRSGSSDLKTEVMPTDLRRPSEPVVEAYHPKPPSPPPAVSYDSQPEIQDFRTNSPPPRALRPNDQELSLPKTLVISNPIPLSENSKPEVNHVGKKSPPPRPPRPEGEQLSPEFLEGFKREPTPMVSLGLQNSFPRNLPNNEGQSDADSSRKESVTEEPLPQAEPKPTSETELSNLPHAQPVPPRGDSKTGTRVDHRLRDAPPVPRPVQLHRQDSTHSPSESRSSTSSSANSASNSNNSSNISSGLSPAGSATSSIDVLSPLSFDAERFGGDAMMPMGLNLKIPSNPETNMEQSRVVYPPRNFARPVAFDGESPQKTGQASPSPVESPMDPALQNGQVGSMFATWQPASPTSPVRSPEENDTTPWPMLQGPTSRPVPAVASPSPTIMTPERTQSPLSIDSPPLNSDCRPLPNPYSIEPIARTESPNPRQPPPRQGSNPARPASRRATSTKSPCRGCGQVIEGKSVKASDGRLTGRWHKACFVCRSCRAPFTTADFYVINNEPYCEHHYHEKNGSLCSGCNRGIEGEYLETSSFTREGRHDKKFHPRCFTCWECRTVLSNDYFEINGKVHCERHALAAMRAQARLAPGPPHPGRRGLTAERRTTRLMMMS